MRRRMKFPSLLLSIAVCAALLVLAILAAGRIGRDTSRREQDGLEAALQRDITNCYALEGFYPPDLQYMKDHYGLTYDTSAYLVDYQPVAANIRPSCTVIPLGQ